MRIDDPVIRGGGLVGNVTAVERAIAVVTLITSPTLQVSARVQNTTSSAGEVVSEVGDPNRLLLEDLPADATVRAGQLVVTSGFRDGPIRSPYPPGIPIGTISADESNPLIPNKEVPVTPLVDVRRLRAVEILIGRNHGKRG